MSNNLGNSSLVAQSSEQPAQAGLVENVVDQIVNNTSPVYPNSFVKMINDKTGVLTHTIKSISHSIHTPQNKEIIYKMASLMILKASIGKPNGSGDFACYLQSCFHDKAFPEAFKLINERMKVSLMPYLNCGKKPYRNYRYEWRKRLSIVAWSVVAYNLVQIVKQQT